MNRRKCGLKPVISQHPLELVAFTYAAFQAQLEAPIGLAPRGLASALCENRGGDKPDGSNNKATPPDFTVKRQMRVVKSSFCAEINGLVWSTVLSRCCGYSAHCIKPIAVQRTSPERMIDVLGRGPMYPPLNMCVDVRAVRDVIGASDACELAGSSLKFNLISVRMTYGLIRKFPWVDTRDLLPHSASNDCKYQATHEAFVHTKHSSAGSATMPRLEDEDPLPKEEQ